MRRRGSEVYTHVRSFVSVYNKSAPVWCLDTWPARSTTAMSTRRAPRSTHESTRGGCAEKKTCAPCRQLDPERHDIPYPQHSAHCSSAVPRHLVHFWCLGYCSSPTPPHRTHLHTPRPLHRSHLPTVLSNSIIAALTCLRTVSRFTPRSVSVFCRHRKVSCSIALVLQSILGDSTGGHRQDAAGRKMTGYPSRVIINQPLSRA